MSTEQALLAAVWDRPHDDLPRLAYADWLDERGTGADVARAEFIRVQCELERLPADDPRFDRLEDRQTPLIDHGQAAWWKAVPRRYRGFPSDFARGFPVPTLERHPVPDLVRLKEGRLRAAPLWRYHYGVYGRDLEAFAGWPAARRLGLFTLRPPLPKGWAARLAGGPFENAADLQLIGCRPTADDLRTVLDGWRGRPLTGLRFDPTRLGPEGFEVVATHPSAAGLRRLVLEPARRVPRDGLAVLFRGWAPARLVRLTLDGFGLGDDGLEDLLAWPGVGRLRSLSLERNKLTDAGAARLAAARLPHLRNLFLSGNRVGVAGVRAVAESDGLRGLTYLAADETPASRSDLSGYLLRKRFGNDYCL